MPLALILPRGDQWYLLRKPLIRRDKGDTLSLLVQFLLKLRVPCAPPPASLLISTIFELAATGPTLPFLHLFLVPPKSPPFPPWRLQLFSGFLRFLASFSPSPTLPSFPFPSSPYVCMYVCVWSHMHIARVWIDRVRLPTLHVASWTGKMNISLSAFAPENLVSREGFGSPVPHQPAHLHTRTESGAYLRDSSRVPRRCPFINLKPP